jgi:hypothetical protein
MPYFKNNDINVLFIHIPKTGGTTLESYFSEKYNIPLNLDSLYEDVEDNNCLDKETKIRNHLEINATLQHLIYRTIMKYKDFFKIDCANLEVITIVRNPYERIISDLFWYNKITLSSTKEEVFLVIKKYLKERLDNHNIPQYLFITDANKNLIPGIKILHTETLKKDMIELGYTDFDNHYYKNKNTTRNNINYYDFLNQDSIQLINWYYHYDFELFHYEKVRLDEN